MAQRMGCVTKGAQSLPTLGPVARRNSDRRRELRRFRDSGVVFRMRRADNLNCGRQRRPEAPLPPGEE